MANRCQHHLGRVEESRSCPLNPKSEQRSGFCGSAKIKSKPEEDSLWLRMRIMYGLLNWRGNNYNFKMFLDRFT